GQLKSRSLVFFHEKTVSRSGAVKKPSLSSMQPALALGVLESLPDLDRAPSKIIDNEISAFKDPEFKRRRRPTAAYLTDLFLTVCAPLASAWILMSTTMVHHPTRSSICRGRRARREHAVGQQFDRQKRGRLFAPRSSVDHAAAIRSDK